MTMFREYGDYQPLGDKNYVVTEEIKWELLKSGSGFVLRIPVGFMFNFSCPRVLSWLINPNNPKYMLAACVHDYLLLQKVNRGRSSIEFFYALRALGVGTYAATILTAGVMIWVSIIR